MGRRFPVGSGHADELQRVCGMVVKVCSHAGKNASLRAGKNFNPRNACCDSRGTRLLTRNRDGSAFERFWHITVSVLLLALQREKKRTRRDFSAVVRNGANFDAIERAHRANFSPRK